MRCFLLMLCLSTVLGCTTQSTSYLDPSEMGRYPLEDNHNRQDAIELTTVNSPAALAAPDAETPQVEALQRQVIYSASLRLVVVSTSEASASIRKIADSLGGYLQESDSRSITIRVPAKQFEIAVEQIARQGEVIDRVVKASDVTEQMMDLNIRLDNAKKTRERLLALMEKMDKVEETLKIEAELLRLTTEIETIEGKLRFMQSQIAMSTIRVELNSTQPRQVGGDPLGLPFPWISRLGDGLVAGTVESMPRKPRLFSGGPKFTPPAEFLRYYADENLVEAMNADGVRIKVQKQENYDKGDLAFWKKLVRRSLVEHRALPIERDEAVDNNAALLVGSREVAGAQFGYMLLLARNDRDLYTFEAWGPKSQFDALRGELEKSARSMQR
jgi:hypothetical protein